uniref:Uncharacterized protein n=1 Tax=Klebsiella quasipneumoniae TaxID=1463165 RepID=A0A483KDI8_9ENTR
MGWSLPVIPKKNSAQQWSPWLCLLIVLLGFVLSLIIAVLDSPENRFLSFSSGYWLPMILQTTIGCFTVVTFYTFWWEVQAFAVWRWNSWRHNTNLLWFRRAHKHHFVSFHCIIPANSQLLPKIAGVSSEGIDEEPPLTLLPDEPLTPGISRFEQLCRLLFVSIPQRLLDKHSGNLTVILLTSSSEKEAEQRAFRRLWDSEKLSGLPYTLVLPKEFAFKDWNQCVSTTCGNILVLAMHYRQPNESLPEFASILLLKPSSLVKQGEYNFIPKIFHAMPLRGNAMENELIEWHDMGQQPSDQRYLVWHSGLNITAQQELGRVLNTLPLPLVDNIGAGGVIDFDKEFGVYKRLAGWLMIASACEMTRYGPATHLLLCENENEGWAVTIGKSCPVISPQLREFYLSPFPAGTVMMALLFSVSIFGLIANCSPSIAFSWSGMMIFSFLLVVSFSFIAILTRNVISKLLYPRFVKAVRQPKKERFE